MAKVKYCARENKKTGTHSFFAQPVFNGTISMDEQDDITQGNENVDGGQPSSGDDEPTSGDGNINGGGGGEDTDMN